MPPSPSDGQLSQAILESVEDGLYPGEEEILSAELPHSALKRLEELLGNARHEVETSIRELSRLSATDIDGWISQAKQLRHGIEASKSQSDEVVTLAEKGKQLTVEQQDVSGKATLLATELQFYNSLASILDQIQDLTMTIHSSEAAISADRLLDALGLLKKAQTDTESFNDYQNTFIRAAMIQRVVELKSTIAASLTEQWNHMIRIDQGKSKIIVEAGSEGSSLGADGIARALSSLDLLRDYVSSLSTAYVDTMLVPFIKQFAKGSPSSFAAGEHSLQLTQKPKEEAPSLFTSLVTAIQFPTQKLPVPLSTMLGEHLAAATTSYLVSNYLPLIIPADLGGIQAFQATLEDITNFSNALSGLSESASQILVKWVRCVPQRLTATRLENSLDSIRRVLERGLGSPRAVERVETEEISSQDDVFAAKREDEDWNAGWDEDAEDEPQGSRTAQVSSTKQGYESGDEGDDAWGFGEEEASETRPNGTMATTQEENGDGDAWGWGDEEEDEAPDSQSSAQPSSRQAAPLPTTSGQPSKSASKTNETRTVTLRETYYITAIPEQILEIVVMVIEDAETLARSNSQNLVASAASELSMLPESFLAMYRAVAPNFYGENVNGNMLIYNDSLYMAEQMRSFLKLHQTTLKAARLQRLEADISTLEHFGKRTYSKEMESQRVVVRDLLDDAQGFVNCADQPFAQQCDLAMSSTIDRLKDVYRQWLPILSRSALMQSIGSLLSTVTNKIIIDIGDMSDISEQESQRLAVLCNRLTELDNLFLPEQPPDSNQEEPRIPLTAGYTSNWLKFQYLVNILESSLIDIKYLWTEGELSLEFSAEEVIDLIEALFADSDHRRRAISEIRQRAAGPS